MLTRITIANVKGITRTVELEKINLIHGPNGSGKTALIDGLKLSLLGYHPRLGKKPNLTFQLATPGATCMTVATDNCNITWSKNAKGAVTVDGIEGVDMPSVMLDIGEWMALSGPARIQYIVEHSGQVLGDAVEKVDRMIPLNPKLEPDAKKLDRKDTAKFLRELMTLAKSNKQVASAELDVVQGAINQAPTAAGKPHENPEREIRALVKTLEERQKLFTELETRKNSLNRTISELKKQIEKNPDQDTEEAEAALVERRQIADSLVGEVSALEHKIGNLKIEEASLAERHRLLKAELARLLETIASAKSLGSCPSCGQKTTPEHVASLEEQVEESSVSLDELDLQLESIREDLKASSSSYRTKKDGMTKAAQAVASTEAQISKHRTTSAIREDLVRQLDATCTELENQPAPPDDIPALIAQRDQLSQAAKEYAAWKGTERERARAIEEKAIKHQALEQAKELISAIKEAEEGLLKQVIGGLLERANALVVPVLDRSLEYRDGEFCLGKANLNTVSGSEECVIFAGLQLALTPLLTERILVLDEIRRMDSDRMERLLKAIEQLIKTKVISQFVGALPGEAPKSDVEYNAIECGGAQ